MAGSPLVQKPAGETRFRGDFGRLAAEERRQMGLAREFKILGSAALVPRVQLFRRACFGNQPGCSTKGRDAYWLAATSCSNFATVFFNQLRTMAWSL